MQEQDELLALLQRVLGLSRADEAQAAWVEEWVTHLRYGANQPTTTGTYHQPTLTVSCSFGRKTASASTNQFDPASLESVVRRAEELARLSPDDPEHVAGLGPQEYTAVPQRQAPGPEVAPALARGVADALSLAKKMNLVSSGFVRSIGRREALVNTRGLRAVHEGSHAEMSQTTRTRDGSGSGWATRSAQGAEQLAFEEVARVSSEKASRSQKPRAIAPGKYTTILEPDSVATLLRLMLWNMDARSADEGRSYFSKPGGTRLGEALFGPDVTIYSAPEDPRVTARPFHTDGRPQRTRHWIRQGKLETLHNTRFWAKQQSRESIPNESNLIMVGGDRSLDELIASTARGLLITRLWYIRSVDPKTLLHTGLTRDGVFMIENGEIAYPVKNLRWNESPVRALKSLDGMTEARRVSDPLGWSANMTDVFVPALRFGEFEFTSTTDAV